MKRTSTKEHEFEFEFDVEQYIEKFMITYSQNNVNVFVFTEKDVGSKVSINKNTLTVSLSQEDTKKFEQGIANIEIKVFTKNKKVLFNEEALSTYIENVYNEELFNEN